LDDDASNRIVGFQEWNNLILSHFLEATNLASTKGSIMIPCIEYPEPKNRIARYICTRKARAVPAIQAPSRTEDVYLLLLLLLMCLGEKKKKKKKKMLAVRIC
jgi:hypothetical protein